MERLLSSLSLLPEKHTALVSPQPQILHTPSCSPSAELSWSRLLRRETREEEDHAARFVSVPTPVMLMLGPALLPAEWRAGGKPTPCPLGR